MFKLTEYQVQGAKEGLEVLRKYNLMYLMWEPRVRKTATVLTIAKEFNNVLFITKKKAMDGITRDYNELNYKYNLEVTNYESLHKVERLEWDLIIIDEAHRLGGYPKPPKTLKDIKKFKCDKHILLSGTPCPESWSQIYHQLAVSKYSPFAKYNNFYTFFRKENLLKIKEPKKTGFPSNNYSLSTEALDSYIEAQDYPFPIKDEIRKLLVDHNKKCTDFLKDSVKHITLTKTQEDAGFKTVINDIILTVEMKPITYQIANRLLKDNIVEGKSGVILADTGVKLQQKLHQIYSGSCKLEDDSTVIIDTTKAEYIKEKFKGKIIGIFYKFKAEWEILQSVFGDDITQDVTDKTRNIAGQLLSIREGVSLKHCDALVFYNIDFSNVSYLQARDRANGLDVDGSDVYFTFAKGGIEEKIYKTITVDKKKYNLTAFKKDYSL